MTRRSFDNPNGIEARQHLLDNRCERKHPKRHRTRKRASKLSALKRSRIAAKLKAQNAKRAKFYAAVRAYWAGERDDLPPQLIGAPKSFWDSLSNEQRARVLAFGGNKNHGDPDFPRRAATNCESATP